MIIFFYPFCMLLVTIVINDISAVNFWIREPLIKRFHGSLVSLLKLLKETERIFKKCISAYFHPCC